MIEGKQIDSLLSEVQKDWDIESKRQHLPGALSLRQVIGRSVKKARLRGAEARQYFAIILQRMESLDSQEFLGRLKKQYLIDQQNGTAPTDPEEV